MNLTTLPGSITYQGDQISGPVATRLGAMLGLSCLGPSLVLRDMCALNISAALSE